jgi:hypothetical protein
MQNKTSTENDRMTRDILRETRQKCKFLSLFVTLLVTAGTFCDFLDMFILNFVESIVGVELKYERNPNVANIYESLLLEKFTFSYWTPFGEKSVTTHLAIYIYIYIYIEIPVLMFAIRAESVASVLLGTMIYISLQFKCVNNSLENLSKMENSDCLIEKKHIQFPGQTKYM